MNLIEGGFCLVVFSLFRLHEIFQIFSIKYGNKTKITTSYLFEPCLSASTPPKQDTHDRTEQLLLTFSCSVALRLRQLSTCGSSTLSASSRAGMRRGACGFRQLPAALLIFTRVWILTHTHPLSKQMSTKNRYNCIYKQYRNPFLPERAHLGNIADDALVQQNWQEHADRFFSRRTC